MHRGGKKTLEESRINEWFVPRFGPPKFRAFVGLLFLPYTGMCIAFALIGALLSPEVIHWDRVGAIVVIYGLALGIGAHAADAIGSKNAKPWGTYFTKSQMVILLVTSLAIAYAIGVFYILFYVPALAIVAILEGFFLFAYNFELWKGRFHTNFWFAVSWGAMPVTAGYTIQTGSMIGMVPLLASAIATIVSLAEIMISRQYKQLKKEGRNSTLQKKLEGRLKLLSLSTIAFSLLLFAARVIVG